MNRDLPMTSRTENTLINLLYHLNDKLIADFGRDWQDIYFPEELKRAQLMLSHVDRKYRFVKNFRKSNNMQK